MSAFAEGSPPDWFQDISHAFASSRQTPPERRLQAFLATLSAETLRLAVAESAEQGREILGSATTNPTPLFQDLHTTVSDEAFVRLTPACPRKPIPTRDQPRR